MPELPEVETLVRQFRPDLEGARIRDFRSRWKKNAWPSPALVRAAVCGRTIRAVTRRAKYIVLTLDDGARLLIHLRMSGRLRWAEDGPPEHVRAWWDLDERRLLFCDARKFGKIILARGDADPTRGLGPEPLRASFAPAALGALLRRRARQLKPLLLDQSVIAGLGNIYADEALHRAGLHPLCNSANLTDPQVRRLHRAIRGVLREGIRRQGTTIDWVYPSGNMQNYLRVYGRTGEPCRRCGAPIRALRVAQRGTHICPVCQPPPPRL